MKEKPKKKKEGAARLLELAGPKKRKLVGACVFSVLSSAARIVPFFTVYGVIRELLAHYTQNAEMSNQQIFLFAGITLAAALAYGICGFVSTMLAHGAAYDVILEIRLLLMEKLSRISSGYFTGTTQGAIKKILSDDTEQIEGFIAHHVADIAAAVATPVLTLLFLFFVDWRLTLVLLAPIIISMFLLGSSRGNPQNAQLQVEMHDAKERMDGTIVEYVHGMPVVKIFNRTLSAFARFEGDIGAYVGSVSQNAHAFSKPIAAYYAFFGAQLLFLLPACLLLMPKDAGFVAFLPTILLFFIVGLGLKEPLENMMQMMILSSRIFEGVKRIDNVLDQPETAEGGTGDPQSYDITFENVSFSYKEDKAQAVSGVNGHLPEGSVTGLVGPSGGGKSTLAQLLLRFYEPQQGCIRIGGVDIREIPAAKLSGIISYVFQDSFLFHDTIENNIRMGNEAAPHAEVERAAQNAGIHEVIMALPLGYDTVIGENDAYLSGGEKQRIAIARVFLKNTPIVILDEATAYADAENEAKIQAAFARLSKGKTVLIIAHRLKTVEKATQIMVINHGKLTGCGTHAELLEGCGLYADLVAANERRDRWTIRKEVV